MTSTVNISAPGRCLSNYGFSYRDDSFHVVNLSGGKDSTAMLLLMLERGMPIDLVISADTGMEFPEMYAHLAKVDDFLYRERGIHIVTLRYPKSFEWLMFEAPKQKAVSIAKRQSQGIPIYGNGWPSMRVRWCTGMLKTNVINKEIGRIKGTRSVVSYIGIAKDEPKRIKNDTYPLVKWGVTEAQALQICYERGFDFGGLYQIYLRASCWCCPLKRIDELRKLRRHHPELWNRLRDMDHRAKVMFGSHPQGRFKHGWSVEHLEERFLREDEQYA